MPRVGWLWSGRSAGNPSEVVGFQQGLRELGYVEGKNIIVEYRFGENIRLLNLASDLAGLKLNLILAVGTASAKAAQQSAPTSPIIFMSGDPLGTGLVTSPSRPSGNLTGVSVMTLSESRLAHLDDHHQGRDRIKRGQASAEIIDLQHGAASIRSCGR